MTTTTLGTIAASIPTPDRERASREAWRQGILASLAVVSAVLAARLILLLAVVGAFAIAYITLASPGPWPAAIFGAYVVGIVAPLVWLASRR